MNTLSEILFACKDIIDDAKIGCADLVFKDICLDVLAKARLVLSTEEFEELTVFVNQSLNDEIVPRKGRRIRIQ